MSIFWTGAVSLSAQLPGLFSPVSVCSQFDSMLAVLLRKCRDHIWPRSSSPSGSRLLRGSQCWSTRGGRRARPPGGCSLRPGHVGHGHDDRGGGQGLQGAGDGGHPRLHSPHYHPAHFHRVTLLQIWYYYYYVNVLHCDSHIVSWSQAVYIILTTDWITDSRFIIHRCERLSYKRRCKVGPGLMVSQ